jgi:hypothetical protein
VLLAHLKLRQRNLAPLLDANGWAVNAQARISLPFGATLTSTARLPKGAVRSLRDPFAEKKRPWKTYLALIVLIAALVLAWREGYLDTWLVPKMPQPAEETSVSVGETPAVDPVSTSPAPTEKADEPVPETSEPTPAATPEPVAPGTDAATPDAASAADSAESTPAADAPANETAD